LNLKKRREGGKEGEREKIPKNIKASRVNKQANIRTKNDTVIKILFQVSDSRKNPKETFQPIFNRPERI